MDNCRRDFLKVSFVLGGSLFLSPSFAWLKEGPKYLTSAIRQLDGNYGLVVVNFVTKKYQIISLNHRCHSMAFSQLNKQVLFFDRRPGQYIYVVNADSAKTETTISAPQKRRFYGHGCFSVDEKYLYVPANDLETLNGVILVYDVLNDYKLISEFSSGGIGPHELVRHPTQDILYICNGGLKTHPDSGREILNLDTMSSNLTIISLDKKNAKKSFSISSPKLSMRHIDLNHRGDAIIGIQDNDFFPEENKSLVAFYNSEEQTLKVEESSGDLFTKNSGYVASVAIDNSSQFAVSTCPKGDSVILWDFQKRKIIKTYELREASGVCFDSKLNQFIVTSGQGDVVLLKGDKIEKYHKFSFQWDNHAELF